MPMVREVVVFCYPGMAAFDLAGPAQALAVVPGGAYALHLVSLVGGVVASDCMGVGFDSIPLRACPRRFDTLLIPGGNGVFEASRDAATVRAVALLGRRAARLATVCVGAFLAAEAGLIAGRRVATHWRACARLAEQFPDLAVDPDAIWVRDGTVWSSAGVSAGVDLALALIETDLGAQAALHVARELVVFLKRPGGQRQFSVALEAQVRAAKGRFGALLDWLADNLAADLRTERLAERANMSPRGFARGFPAEIGVTPARYVERLRAERARQLIQTTSLPFERIAGQCGLRDVQGLRRALKRCFGADPSALRARFGRDDV